MFIFFIFFLTLFYTFVCKIKRFILHLLLATTCFLFLNFIFFYVILCFFNDFFFFLTFMFIFFIFFLTLFYTFVCKIKRFILHLLLATTCFVFLNFIFFYVFPY